MTTSPGCRILEQFMDSCIAFVLKFIVPVHTVPGPSSSKRAVLVAFVLLLGHGPGSS